MALFTKADAALNAAAYQNKFIDRIDRYLRNLAQSGVVGGTLSYSNVDGLTTDRAQAVRAALEAAGWTVTVDTVTKTVTIT